MATIEIRNDGQLLTWEDGKFTGDETMAAEIRAEVAAGDASWIPVGYPVSTGSPNVIDLAARRLWPECEIEATPPLDWPDELEGLQPPDDSVAADEVNSPS